MSGLQRYQPCFSECRKVDRSPGLACGLVRQPEALRAHPELRAVSRLTLKESFRCLRLALWDEDQQRLVAFEDARSAVCWQSS